MSDFGHTPNTEDGMMCYKERHPLLLDYFIPFLKYIRMVGRSTGGLYDLLMGYTTCHFYQ